MQGATLINQEQVMLLGVHLVLTLMQQRHQVLLGDGTVVRLYVKQLELKRFSLIIHHLIGLQIGFMIQVVILYLERLSLAAHHRLMDKKDIL